MKLSTTSAFALALLLGAGQTSAIPQEAGIESTEESMPAEQTIDGESEEFLLEEAPYDEATAADNAAAESDSGDDEGWMDADDEASQATGYAEHEPAAEEELSDGQRFKRSLKRMLLGVLMPAMEREVREAVDPDQAQSDPDSGLESDP